MEGDKGEVRNFGCSWFSRLSSSPGGGSCHRVGRTLHLLCFGTETNLIYEVGVNRELS